MLNSMTNVLIIEEKKTDVQKRKPCKDKAQIGVMQSQTKEELQTTRSQERGKEDISLTCFKGDMTFRCFDFIHLDCGALRQ